MAFTPRVPRPCTAAPRQLYRRDVSPIWGNYRHITLVIVSSWRYVSAISCRCDGQGVKLHVLAARRSWGLDSRVPACRVGTLHRVTADVGRRFLDSTRLLVPGKLAAQPLNPRAARPLSRRGRERRSLARGVFAHSLAQHIIVQVRSTGRLRHRPPHFRTDNCLQLELAAELPSLHHHPRAPKHSASEPAATQLSPPWKKAADE